MVPEHEKESRRMTIDGSQRATDGNLTVTRAVHVGVECKSRHLTATELTNAQTGVLESRKMGGTGGNGGGGTGKWRA